MIASRCKNIQSSYVRIKNITNERTGTGVLNNSIDTTPQNNHYIRFGSEPHLHFDRIYNYSLKKYIRYEPISRMLDPNLNP
jgi:hypothetical protein